MPPKRGIVKSGNAGNSSKSVVGSSAAADSQKSQDNLLFPPGYKYPLSLLNERAQKNGWEKPHVDTHRHGDGYSFSVTLSRVSKKNERESVRLEPHPPYVRPSALEARHWGATYALYRFCNGMKLNLVLPPGPRDYWNELAAEHKNVPDHQKWEYEADPFTARKGVDERQEKATKRREEKGKGPDATATTSTEFSNAPEAKMAGSLRDLVEEAIKKAIELYPEAGDSTPVVLEPEQISAVMQQLQHLGFTPVQARQATTALSTASELTSTLLASLGPLQACVEYLILHVPECDLPERFLPAANSSNPFVSSMHSGSDNIKRRWIRDKAIKECGWPEHVVNECLTDPKLVEDWAALVKSLNNRLVGVVDDAEEDYNTDEFEASKQVIDEDELQSFQARFVEDLHLEIPSPVAPLNIHILLPPDRTLSLAGNPPPMYITSKVAAAYVRLHLLSKVLVAFRDASLVQPGESVFMAILRLLEEEWAVIEDEGPPDMSAVLHHMLPAKPDRASGNDDSSDAVTSAAKGGRSRRRAVRIDDRTDSRIKEDFENARSSNKYKELLSSRERLPAYSAKEEFLKMLEHNRCVVVVGETGCGKTTQLPQFVLDSLILANKGSTASIIVTQPRRLSAIGVAARVSAERMEDGSVGYAIRGESKQDKRTKLLFCTTGVVLRRLGGGDKLQGVSHVIVDEVHERSVDGDFLMLELKELLKHHPHLKVILMSATINHEVFVKYFNNAPLLAIPGLTHPVKDLYLEDYLPRISYTPSSVRGKRLTEREKNDISSELAGLTLDAHTISSLQAIVNSDRVDFELINSLVNYIVATAAKPGGILIFLPGVQDIRQCVESLRNVANAKVLPLHANLSSDEQRSVFAPTPGWKIVVATNVAETSITIDDIIYVIDSGKVKETQYDPENGLTRLTEQWVTRAAAKQRRGRAGRTQPGVCYKLYTRRQEGKMSPYPIPEIKRVALESVALTVKVVHDDVKAFLARAIDPPAIAAIDHALHTLTELGAVSDTEELTPLGQYLAMLPVDLRLGKMLVLGTVFQCLNPILTVAACLSSKPLFLSPMDKREEATRARQRFVDGNSDLLTDVRAFEECTQLRASGGSKARAFCEENFISVSAVRDINSLRQEFLSVLISMNLVPPGSVPTSPGLNTNSNYTGLIKAVLLAGLWPRVARVSLPRGAIKFDRVQAGTVQRANEAKEFKFFDIRVGQQSGRVFLHPASILFHSADWKSPFVAYFQKQATSKIFLRDATEVPIYALLLFGGPVTVNHIGGGLTIGNRDAFVKLKAWPRIGVLVNQLRRLLDAQLKRTVDTGATLDIGKDNPVVHAVLALLQNDGLTS